MKRGCLVVCQEGLDPKDAILEVSAQQVRLSSLSGSWPGKEAQGGCRWRDSHEPFPGAAALRRAARRALGASDATDLRPLWPSEAKFSRRAGASGAKVDGFMAGTLTLTLAPAG